MQGLVYASTSLLHSRSQFTKIIDSVRSLCKDHVLLFALSHDAPELEQSVKELSSCASESIGCLSGQLPIDSEQPFFSCSTAIFDAKRCLPFSTLESGEGPVQVGRWHAYDKKRTTPNFDALRGQGLHVNWDDVWNTKGPVRSIPQELRNSLDSRTIMYFSDDSSWELAMALQKYLPQAQQLGIMASATPFVTGRPFTLLRNGKAQSSGAVGVVLEAAPSDTVVSYNEIVRLTKPLVVQRSEGNLIHELGDSSPARVLLKAIQDHGLPDDQAKDVDYYIGIRDGSNGKECFPRLFRIVAGSPSRGSIAIEDVPAPPVGSPVEFYSRPKDSPIRLPPHILEQSGRKSEAVIGAIVNSIESSHIDSQLKPHPENSELSTIRTFDSSFLASSEQGFLLSANVSRKTPVPWKCTIPGAFGGIRLS